MPERPEAAPLAQHVGGEVSNLMTASEPGTLLSDMVLAPLIRSSLDQVLRELRAEDKLRAFGLTPSRKLLLVGPPGTGKTMTSSALAGELGLPLYVVNLHSLFSRFLGETASRLRLIFDAISEHRGVYLFDEFDAIGAERASTNDVGEVRRALNSFLMMLEQDQSSSVLVAATNLPQSLDEALFRRFDLTVSYGLPTGQDVEVVIRNRLSRFDVGDVDWLAVRKASEGLSFSEVVSACDVAAKGAVLADESVIRTDPLFLALSERRSSTSSRRGVRADAPHAS
jgi:SpoVK/Ycf46/Vps4 family AAA+-type ATPase